jgi:serine/threonine protein kinase
MLQGRYLIERLISQGGMGAVYQALDQRLGHTVALKHILVGESRMRKAFEREARLLAGLRHNALPVVSDHFTEGKDQFLVMQYIPGDDIGMLLERQNTIFTSREAMFQVLAWADQLLDLLDYLHSHSPPIIHRDIKPQNLKITPRGELVLLDFGLAKGAINTKITSMTGLSLRAYTTQYAPLEQIQGTGTEARSDLYALGATLYHVLTGVAPPNALTRAAAVLARQPDPLKPANQLNPNIQPTLAAILQQAMAHGLSKRFASAGAMRSALRMVGQASPASASNTVDSGGQQTIVVSSTSDISTPRLSDVIAMAQEVPEPPRMPAVPALVVDKGARGSYQTISAAIADASPGSRILVRPGLYQESFTIDKRLEISGEGPLTEIIVEIAGGSSIMMQTDYATIRGITFRGHASLQQPTQSTINIPQGRLVLEDCDITSHSRIAIAIHGAAANPVVWRCQVHASKGIGVLFYGRSRGMLEECNIFGHAQAGVAIRNGANPTIRRCKVHHNAYDGVYVDEKGLGTIEECDITENTRAGVEIKRASMPLIRRCTIEQQTQGYGVLVCDHGEGIIEECDIAKNSRAGLAVIQSSQPLVRRCSIHHERQRGVIFGEQASGILEQCDISQNGHVGVEIKQHSEPTLRRCTIKNHSTVAIWVHEHGAGVVEYCDLTDNARGAYYIEAGCKIVKNGNRE